MLNIHESQIRAIKLFDSHTFDYGVISVTSKLKPSVFGMFGIPAEPSAQELWLGLYYLDNCPVEIELKDA